MQEAVNGEEEDALRVRFTHDGRLNVLSGGGFPVMQRDAMRCNAMRGALVLSTSAVPYLPEPRRPTPTFLRLIITIVLTTCFLIAA